MVLQCVAAYNWHDNSDFFFFKGWKLVGIKGPCSPMWFRDNTEISLWFTCFSKCQWFISSHKQDWPKFSAFSRSIFHPNPVQPGEFIQGFTPSLLILWTLKLFFPWLFFGGAWVLGLISFFFFPSFSGLCCEMQCWGEETNQGNQVGC